MSTTSAGSSALVYAMPSPPPRFSSGSSTPSSSRTWASSPTTRCAATSKPAGVEDLRADVRVQADQFEPRRGEHPAYGIEGIAADQREAELLVLVRCRDELVGVRLDTDGGAHQDALRAAALEAEPAQPLDLGQRVDHDPGHSGVECGDQLGSRLVVAVQQHPVAGEAGADGDRELAAGADVEAQPLLLDPARDGGAEERLGGVEHHCAAERLAIVPAAAPQVGLVEQKGRAAVLGHQLAHVVPAEHEVPLVGPAQAQRPDRGVDCAEVGGRPRVQSLVGELTGPRPGGVGTHRRTATSARAR